jgi:hypothetical protein
VLGALGLAAAAACVAVVIALSPGPPGTNHETKAVLVKIQLTAAPVPRSSQLAMSRTPLGAAIAREQQATQQNIRTGDLAQNRKAIAQLASYRQTAGGRLRRSKGFAHGPGNAECSATGSWVLACRRPVTGS